MSKIIHNDITVAGCTSWSYWTAMSVERWSQKNRFELIKTTPVTLLGSTNTLSAILNFSSFRFLSSDDV